MLSDHIEFYNPGGLGEGITPENIVRRQFSRNPILARVLSRVGYIEELGEEWDKILVEHETHPLDPPIPEIEADETSFSVTLFSTREKFEAVRKPERGSSRATWRETGNILYLEGRKPQKNHR